MRLEHLLSGAEKSSCSRPFGDPEERGNDSRDPPEGGHGTASASLLTLQPSSGAAAAECRGNLVIMAPGTREGGLAQLARAPALQAGGQRFESVILHTKERTLTYWKAVRRGAKPLAQANQTDTTRNLNQESNRHKRGEPCMGLRAGGFQKAVQKGRHGCDDTAGRPHGCSRTPDTMRIKNGCHAIRHGIAKVIEKGDKGT